MFIRVVISNQLKCLSNTTFRQFTTALFRYKVLNDYSDTLLAHINSLRDSIKFTMEREVDGSISFLDCQLRRNENNRLSVTVHRKSTHTDKYLSFDSHHPVHVKQGVVKSLFDRARRIISQESDLRKEEDHLNEVLRNNGYPKRFIYVNSKIKKAKPCDEEMEAPLVAIPYVSGLSEDIRRVCRRFGIRVVFRSGMNLRSQLSQLKDVLPMEQRSGVVYEIPCSTCDKSYIGETIRRLGSRLKEHKDACRKCEKDKSALAEHAWDEGHPIAWGKVRILNSDSRRIRLVIKEALHINESKSTLMNRDTGLELPGCWLATLSHFTHAQ